MNRLRALVLLSALLAGCGGPKPVVTSQTGDTQLDRLHKLGITTESRMIDGKMDFSATLRSTPSDAIWDALDQAEGLTSLHLIMGWVTEPTSNEWAN